MPRAATGPSIDIDVSGTVSDHSHLLDYCKLIWSWACPDRLKAMVEQIDYYFLAIWASPHQIQSSISNSLIGDWDQKYGRWLWSTYSLEKHASQLKESSHLLPVTNECIVEIQWAPRFFKLSWNQHKLWPDWVFLMSLISESIIWTWGFHYDNCLKVAKVRLSLEWQL